MIALLTALGALLADRAALSEERALQNNAEAIAQWTWVWFDQALEAGYLPPIPEGWSPNSPDSSLPPLAPTWIWRHWGGQWRADRTVRLRSSGQPIILSLLEALWSFQLMDDSTDSFALCLRIQDQRRDGPLLFALIDGPPPTPLAAASNRIARTLLVELARAHPDADLEEVLQWSWFDEDQDSRCSNFIRALDYFIHDNRIEAALRFQQLVLALEAGRLEEALADPGPLATESG